MPWTRRGLLARKPALMLGVIGIALRAIDRWYAKAVHRPDGAGGAVVAIQRAGSALNLNIHAHALLPDGVFIRDERGVVVFRRAKPSTKDVMVLVERIARSAARYLARKGYPAEEEGEEPDAEDGLALVQAASLGGVIAVGPRRGCAVRRTPLLGGKDRPLPARCASLNGYNLHAETCVAAQDRNGLEILCSRCITFRGRSRIERCPGHLAHPSPVRAGGPSPRDVARPARDGARRRAPGRMGAAHLDQLDRSGHAVRPWRTRHARIA